MFKSNFFGRIFWIDDNNDFKSCPLNVDNTGDFDHQTISNIMELSSKAVGPQVTTRDSYIIKENKMSRRGVHRLLRGFDKPQRAAAPRHPLQASGMESAQRKRYLCLEAEEAKTQVFSHRQLL